MTSVFRNGRFFTATGETAGKLLDVQKNCMVIEGDVISHVGNDSDDQVQKARQQGAREIDLHNHLVVPGSIDSHCHISGLGSALMKLDLRYCQNLDEIRRTIKDYAQRNPHAPHLLCRGWIQSTTGGVARADMLDDLDPRPIFIDANDLHSTWCNSAALQAMDVDARPDPVGGRIVRDRAGKPTGLMLEGAAIEIVWPYLAGQMSYGEKVEAIRRAMDAYAAAGYTGLVDMAMEETDWAILQDLQARGQLRCRIAAYWLILPRDSPAENAAQVERAIALHRQLNSSTSPDLRIQGIKLICDGVVDSCTASFCRPYTSTGSACDPIWSSELLEPVVRQADAAGLQCAFHAIGDRTIQMAIDTIEKCGTRDQRHRIEHLEVTRPEDARRLGDLGITASVQPVHSDPALFGAWPDLLGSARCARAFAYKEFVDHGAPLAIGTDAPTAPFSALENLYIATTRRSAKDPAMTATTNENFALDLATALHAQTKGAAYSCFAETWSGQLRPGFKADFTVWDAHLVPERLLEAKVTQTWFGGARVFGGDGQPKCILN